MSYGFVLFRRPTGFLDAPLTVVGTRSPPMFTAAVTTANEATSSASFPFGQQTLPSAASAGTYRLERARKRLH